MSSFTKAIEEIGVIVLAAGALVLGGPLAAGVVFLAGTAVVNPLAPKAANNTVSPTAWKADPQAGIPYAMGRTFVGGNIIYRQAYGKKNKYQTLVTALSGAGPHEAIETLYVDNVARPIGFGGEVDIPDHGFMYAATQLGRTPEPANLNVGPIDPFAWAADCKLSGYAASIVTLVYDTKGKNTMTNTPSIGWVGKWAKIYDPRKDSTYSGGAGTHRINDETTWEWSENPYLHALTWLIGRRANGKLVLGVGMATSGILIDQFVEGANIADTNGWTMGGVVYSTDDKWDVFKKMLQAGGATPLRLAGRVGCLISTPRVSIATIEVGDLAGSVSVQATQSRKDRINAIVPRYMGTESVTTADSDGNLVTSVTWSIMPAAPIAIASYVAADGRTRQKEVEYSLVQAPNGAPLAQVGALARYDIENAREFGPIKLPLKLRWYGFKPGDVVTCGQSMSEVGLAGQDILLQNRMLSPQDGSVTMTARSETFAKHAFALGQVATPPDTPSVSIPDFSTPSAAAGDWTLTGTTLSSAGGTLPAIEFNLAAGRTVDDVVDSIVFEYRSHVAGQGDDDGWIGTGVDLGSATRKDVTSVAPGGSYDGSVRYRSGGTLSATRLIIGPATAGSLSAGNALQQAVFNSFIVEVQNGTDVVHIASDGTLTIDDHTRRYPDGHADVSVTGATISTGLAAGATRYIAYDDPTRAGGAVTYNLYASSADAWASAANPGRHNVGFFTVPSSGSSGGGGGGIGGGGHVNSV